MVLSLHVIQIEWTCSEGKKKKRKSIKNGHQVSDEKKEAWCRFIRNLVPFKIEKKKWGCRHQG